IINCKVVNAYNSTDNFGINGAYGATGGIIGATSGIASSNIEISNCQVLNTVISSADGQYLGGIVGKRVVLNGNEYGNLAIDDCYVGTNELISSISSKADAKVIIEGQNTIGGIISNAQSNANGSLTITNCTVFGDVYITRTENPTNNADTNILSGQLGTAIGGITGFTEGTSASPVILRGALNFYGLIDINVTPATNNEIKNIGGLIGYMGPYSIISSGAYTEPTIVYVEGAIDGGDLSVKNIGGVAGISNGGALDGEYHLGMTTTTPNAISIGGFIGYNIGNTSIARTGSIESSSTGQIVGNYNVGGFIGNNGWNDANNDGVVDAGEMNNQAIVNIGASTINGALYGTDSDYLSVQLNSSVDGKMHVGGFIGVNAGTVNGQYVTALNSGKIGAENSSKGGTSVQAYAFGGIVGANVANSHFNLTSNAMFGNESSGQVGHQNNNTSFQFYVGGILGVSMGELDIDPNAILYNLGEVYGYWYVGGAIGGLVQGTMRGVMLNQGAVTGSIIVGGVFGIVMQGASIGNGDYVNTGEVQSTASENHSIAGGVIGAMYGTINGSAAGSADYDVNTANFENKGDITAKSYAGGAIGLVEGSINNARFVNSASLTFTGGDSVGGVIGYIHSGNFQNLYPSDASDHSMYDANAVITSVTNTYFGYVSSTGTTTITAGASSHTNLGNDASAGGVGGVIGTIDASEITSSTNWTGNSFFVNGDVTATSADAVGGVIGQVVRSTDNDAPYITINNMLAYNNTISGRNFVGGIVGYNGSANTEEGEDASISNCYKIRGTMRGTSEVGGIVGGYYIPKDDETSGILASPRTCSSYWVYAISNKNLLNINPSDIGGTLTADDFHVEVDAIDYIEGTNVPEGYASWDAYIAAFTPKLSQNANGDWGWYSSNPTPYTTGAAGDYTGYFFVYAYDTEASNTPNFQEGGNFVNGIDATHSHSGSSLQDIDYWKMIASTADAPAVSASDIVSKSDNNGVVKNYTIYATAKGAVVPSANFNYYYLNLIADNEDYIHNYTVNNAGASTVDDNQLFVSIDATQAGNVLIYYKPIYMANSITYDGEKHYAPIKGLDIQSKPATVSGNVYDGIHYEFNGAEGERTLANNQKGYFNAGTDVNPAPGVSRYDVDAYVWFVSEDGYVINLGRVYSRKDDGGAITTYQWRIIPKNLTLTPTWTTGTNNNATVDYNTYHQGLYTLTVSGLYARDIGEDGILNITLQDSASADMHMTSKQIAATESSVTYQFANAIDASTPSGGQNSITYSVICESNNGNYTINGQSVSSLTYSWTIKKYDYKFEIEADVEGDTVVY
ncbi:MAG: hypothetical protein MJ193_00840, partial [Clostridia bacterium]|nr:hypothetical protein [Clostridia bacterium]